jgi:hypothetical protein
MLVQEWLARSSGCGVSLAGKRLDGFHALVDSADIFSAAPPMSPTTSAVAPA